MVNKRPGYWDVDGCRWVGVDPSEVGPPRADPSAGTDTGAGVPTVPAPRLAMPTEVPGQPVS